MQNKILLVVCDGMRPDAVSKCNHPFYIEMCKKGSWTLSAKTVMPSVTLPCHMSLFHSVTPQRHGILTNTYVPQVRPVNGICEAFSAAGKSCAMFYDWEELRDLARPQSLVYSSFYNTYRFGFEKSSRMTTAAARSFIPENKPDFVFMYFCYPDEIGHNFGWMSDDYLKAVNDCWDMIESVASTIGDEYNLIVTADHGGHDRMHGFDVPEDMTIPMFCLGSAFEAGMEIASASILDVAPTVAALCDVLPDKDWEGKCLFLKFTKSSGNLSRFSRKRAK